MVMKICKVCGKEFDARGTALTCGPECRKINENNNKKKYRQSDKGKATQKRYQQSEKGKAANKKYRQSDKGRDAVRKYEQSGKGKATRKSFKQNKIAELNEKYDGDLESILKDCPNSWMVREAIMLVEYGISYSEAMYQKIQANPVCEVTGRDDNLVIHHLDSFNICPESGADLDNLVRITKEIHDEFYNIYGRGNNTREQWFEFLDKKTKHL